MVNAKKVQAGWNISPVPTTWDVVGVECKPGRDLVPFLRLDCGFELVTFQSEGGRCTSRAQSWSVSVTRNDSDAEKNNNI